MQRGLSCGCILALVLCLLTPSTTCAQSNPAFSTSNQQSRPLFPSPLDIGKDASYVLQSPLRMETQDVLTAAGMAGLTAGIVSVLDRPTFRSFHGPDGSPSTRIPHHLAGPGRVYDQIGPTRFILGTAGTFAASGLLTNDRHLTRTSVHIVEAALLTQVLTGVAKQTIGRSRPYTREGPFEAEAFEFDGGHAARSMPSGHTSKIFAVASVIAHEYDAWWVKAAAYGTATSAGIQRIESGKHWLSDVFVGAMLGYFVGKTIADAPARNTANRRVTYQPVVSPSRVGLSIRF